MRDADVCHASNSWRLGRVPAICSSFSRPSAPTSTTRHLPSVQRLLSVSRSVPVCNIVGVSRKLIISFHQAMQEIHQLRAQISSIAKVPLSKLLPPNDTQHKVLRQILAAGFIDQVAVREDLVLKKGVSYESTRGVAYRAVGLGSEPVFIHPSSALFHRAPPDFVVFSEIVRTSKPWMKGVTKINPAWLPSLGKGLCTFSKPMEMPTKGFARKSVLKDDEREVFVTPHFKDLGVDLPVMKKKQRREGTRWILVD